MFQIETDIKMVPILIHFWYISCIDLVHILYMPLKGEFLLRPCFIDFSACIWDYHALILFEMFLWRER